MEKLETLIQELYQDGTREKNMEVLSHIRKLAKEKNNLLFLLAMQKVKKSIEDYL